MATPTAGLIPGLQQYLDNNGNPLAGGTLAYYVPNTTTLASVWIDDSQTTPATNPVPLDAGGVPQTGGSEVQVYADSKLQATLRDASGALVRSWLTEDPVSVANQVATTVVNNVLAGAGFVPPIANIAALRAATTATLPQVLAWVEGWYAGDDGGQGMFWVNAGDVSSSDNGGTIIVDGSGRRWYRSLNNARITVKQFGAKGDWNGTTGTNDQAAINAALAAAKPGQEVWLDATGQYLVDSVGLTVPKGVALRAAWRPPGTTNNSSVSGQPLDLTTLGGAIVLNSTVTIALASGAELSGIPIYRKGLVIPASDASLFAGTAITIQGDDVALGYLLVLGFALLSTSNTQVRGRYEWVWGDNVAGIQILSAFDTPYLHHCHMWPFCTYWSDQTNPATHRSGTAYQIDGTSLPSLAQCFEYGYLTGYELEGSGGPVMVDCQADGTGEYVGTVGFKIGNGTNGATSGKLIGCTSFNQTVGYQPNLPATDFIEMVGCSADGCTTAVDLVQGCLRVIGGVWDTETTGINVHAATSAVVLVGLKATAVSGQIVNNSGGGGTIFVDQNCDFSSFPYGTSISTTMVPDVIASASPLLLHPFSAMQQVTGTTGFGVISGGWAGRQITLVFAGALTITNSGVANGVRLSGSVNFTTAAGSTLSLVHNGTQWFETGRCT